MTNRMQLIVASLLVFASGAEAQLIHSDLPLFTGKRGELHPKGFTDADGFGCTSRVQFGDWKLSATAGDFSAHANWLRLSNYGVFHCAVVESWAHSRESLDRSGFKHSWFVELGRARRGNSDIEIWALQSGSRPGSDYLLLARDVAPGNIKRFDVLPVDCPSRFWRKGNSFDVWGTSYCSINSARDLTALAKRMVAGTPAGTLSYEGPRPEEDASEE